MICPAGAKALVSKEKSFSEMNRHIEIEYFCIQRSYKIPYTLLINHTSYISQNTIDLYTFCLGYVGVRNKPHPSRLKLEKQVF